jgi:hypothetical protein
MAHDELEELLEQQGRELLRQLPLRLHTSLGRSPPAPTQEPSHGSTTVRPQRIC